ncbi:MAG: 50S ribosomal protein L34e [Candidatus Bathyarchaeota archaeon]|nr:50S ribosomal protein L34e [Candidatus Bathyarchaeota archaeon A05DMB-5]MDH7557656.1 50S ribosomal protein L34e [Candidatus Bathyarchaeota archaeon]
MPQPHLRTRGEKQFKVTLPGGKSRIHYKKRVPSVALCFICSRPLDGISRMTTVEIRKLNRSKRRIWRFYGGQVCANCVKKAIRQFARTV